MEVVAVARAPICVCLAGDLEDVTRCYEQTGGPALCLATGYYVYALLARSTLDGVQVVFEGQQSLSRGTTAVGCAGRGVPQDTSSEPAGSPSQAVRAQGGSA